MGQTLAYVRVSPLYPNSGHSSAPKPQHQRFKPPGASSVWPRRPSTESDPSQRKISIFFKLAAGMTAISRQLFSHAEAHAACVFLLATDLRKGEAG